MCHRILRYIMNTQCMHKTFTGDTMIDCQDPTCGNSRAHPANCVNCTHNKWFGSVVTDKLLHAHMHRLAPSIPLFPYLMGLTGSYLTSTYRKPERVITQEVDQQCANCLQQT